jgi:hypothetical protein
MLIKTTLVGSALALFASAALAASPVRTPSNHAVKNSSGNPYPVTQITLDNHYFWSPSHSIRTTFDNRPDSQGRGNPAMTFRHEYSGWFAQLNFQSNWGNNGATAAMNFARNGYSESRNASPNGNGTSSIDYRFNDAQARGQFFFYADRTGYNEVLRSGGYYGAGGFFGVPPEYANGSFNGGMTTFRFENNQDTGNARLLYNVTNDGGQSDTVRARLLYLDRNGEDGYTKIRFTYVASPRPVSPH